MLPEAAAKLTAEALVTQGILGITTFVLACTVVYLYRENIKQRQQYDDDLVEERTRHNAEFLSERNRHAEEIASERRLNKELQDERFKELKSTLATVQAVTESVDAALVALGTRRQ